MPRLLTPEVAQRLLKLVDALSEDRYVSTRELKQRFSEWSHLVYYDLRLLEQMGIVEKLVKPHTNIRYWRLRVCREKAQKLIESRVMNVTVHVQ